MGWPLNLDVLDERAHERHVLVSPELRVGPRGLFRRNHAVALSMQQVHGNRDAAQLARRGERALFATLSSEHAGEPFTDYVPLAGRDVHEETLGRRRGAARCPRPRRFSVFREPGVHGALHDRQIHGRHERVEVLVDEHDEPVLVRLAREDPERSGHPIGQKK